MAIVLEGGCRVTDLKEGTPEELGTVRAWRRAGRATGAAAISLRVLEVGPGGSPALANGCDEVLYVLEGAGSVEIGGELFAIEPDTGFYVRPGAAFAQSAPTRRTPRSAYSSPKKR